MTCIIAEFQRASSTGSKRASPKQPRQVLRKFLWVPCLMWLASGCVTSKAFKQVSTAMKDSSANAVSTIDKLGEADRNVTITILDSGLGELRNLIIDEGQGGSVVHASADLKKIHGDLKVLSKTAPSEITSLRKGGNSTYYEEIRDTIGVSVNNLLIPDSQSSDSLYSEALSVQDDDLAAAAAKCVTSAAENYTYLGANIPWRVYTTQLSCEYIRTLILLKTDLQLQPYVAIASEIKGTGYAIDASVQASWDRDDILKLLDSLNQAVGLAALAVAIDKN